MYDIIYRDEIIDSADTIMKARRLLQEYRMAFKTNDVWIIKSIVVTK